MSDAFPEGVRVVKWVEASAGGVSSQELFVREQRRFEEEWRCYLAALLRDDEGEAAELRLELERGFGLRQRVVEQSA